MNTESLPDLSAVLEREAFASMMGQVGVLVAEDPRWGRQSFAFIGGGVVPYGLFISLLMARITGISPSIALPENEHDDAIAAIWERTRLPESVRTPYSKGVDPHTIVIRLIGEYLERLKDSDKDVRKERLCAFIDQIETRFFEARAQPIQTRALRELNAAVKRPQRPPKKPPMAMY